MINWDKYPYFSKSEFACRHCGVCEMDAAFIEKLHALRVSLKIPFIITSGYRCPEHNKAVGGAPDSPHQEGKAADIKVVGDKAWRLVGAAISEGFPGVGVNQKGGWSGRFIHLDTAENTVDRPRPWMWTY